MGVNVQVVHDGQRRLVVNCVNVADTGVGEADVVKVDLSGTSHLSTAAGGSVATPGSGYVLDKLVLDEVWFTVEGWDGVRVTTDRTTDHPLAQLPAGEGYKDYREYGGLVDQGSGGTGDILFSTYGTNAAGNTYAVLLSFRKKWSNG